MFPLNQCAPLLVMLLVCSAAAPSSRPATTSTSAPTDQLSDPAFWLEKASAEWKQIGPGAPKPWREMAAAQLALRDLAGLSSTLEEAKALKPPTTNGYPYVNDRTVNVYASLVPFFAQAGDEEGMRRAISIATDPSHEAGPDAKSLPLDGNRGSIAKELARIGRDAEALTLANSTRVPRDRVAALIAIAVEAAQAGRTDASNRAFAAASQAANVAEKAQKGMGFRPLAYGYLDAGDFVKALEIGQSLEDESRASFLSQVAVKHSKAGRGPEAAKYAQLATTIIVEGGWQRFAGGGGGKAVAMGVAEADDRASRARLERCAKDSISAPAGPRNDYQLPADMAPPKGRHFRPSESFAMDIYAGLAIGAARRGDAGAAKRYLLANEQLVRSIVNGPPGLLWYKDLPLPVASDLKSAGQAREALAIIDTFPTTLRPDESSIPSLKFHLQSLKNNCVGFYVDAGDFDRAAKLYQAAHGKLPPVFAAARVREGQLAPLLLEVKRIATPEGRCMAYAIAATELANFSRKPMSAPARP
ncbi:MAG: hypothetical protein WBD40_23035 [Tepidisphaeraceae bacterium]